MISHINKLKQGRIRQSSVIFFIMFQLLSMQSLNRNIIMTQAWIIHGYPSLHNKMCSIQRNLHHRTFSAFRSVSSSASSESSSSNSPHQRSILSHLASQVRCQTLRYHSIHPRNSYGLSSSNNSFRSEQQIHLRLSSSSSLEDDNDNIIQKSSTTTNEEDKDRDNIFQPGTKIQVEILTFGVLGASVDVVGINSHNMDDIISENEPAIATGLILQKEISYYRQSRNMIDVVRGEILPAYIEKVRIPGPIPQLDICLRPFGGKAKADELSDSILQELNNNDGILLIGDKSSPIDINDIFPGISKNTFKKTLSALYKQQLIEQPEPYRISLIINKKEIE